MPFIIRPSHFLLGQSATAVDVTGTTDETVLGTVTIPAGVIGVNGGVRFFGLYTMAPNNANNKTLRVRLGGIGGSELFSLAVASSVSYGVEKTFFNRSASSQILTPLAVPRNQGNNAAVANLTTSVDTSVATTLVFTAQLANAGDTATLELYEVELIRP